MDAQRAREILESSENIEVLYNGSPVWLDRINSNNTANITYIDTHRKQEVPIYKLVEVDNNNMQ